MPTKRIRRSRNRKAPISPTAWAVLTDAALPEDHNPFEALELKYPFQGRTERQSLWNEYGPGIVAQWAIDHPGGRPSTWWMFCEPRQRLGGIGTPDFEVLNIVPRFDFGIPSGWVSAWQVEYYNSTEYRRKYPGHFDGLAIDPDDPPTFESEASYLARHGLFLAGERERLTKADFEPERILPRGQTGAVGQDDRSVFRRRAPADGSDERRPGE